MSAKKQSTARPFDEIWTELEERHGWKIRVDEFPADPAISRYPFVFSDPDNRRAIAFREQNKLDELLEGAEDDWEALLRLRHWTFVNMVNHTSAALPLREPFSALDPFALVAASRSGGTFWCSFFSMVLVAACSSTGFVCRKLSIDSEHTADEKGNHHGVVDVWVSKFRKWVHLDPNYDHHCEKDGVPLNLEEICQVWLKQKGEGMQSVIGPERRTMPRARGGRKGAPEACGYFWHLIECRNDVFRRDGDGSLGQAVLLVDEARKHRRWTQGTPPNTFEKRGYANGSLMVTEDYADAYPDVNAVKISLQPPHKMPYYCRAQFKTPFSPFFDHYEVRVNGGAPERVDGMEYPWRIWPGTCSLEVRVVDVAGRRGQPYRIAVTVEEDASVSPRWPWPKEDAQPV